MTRHRCRIIGADRSAGTINVEPDTYPAALVVGKQALLVMDPRAVVISEPLARELLHVAMRMRPPGEPEMPEACERLADAISEARP